MKNTVWPWRGIALDPARLTERYAYYERLIPDLARWGYNTIMLNLADDEGIAVRLPSPKVLHTPAALTPAQWRNLVKLAVDHGITVIPEIECLGHTGFITRLPEYAELREPPAKVGKYWSICPVHPKSEKIMEEVLCAVSEIFPAPYLHIGMDEADIGGSVLCQAALQREPLWRIFGDYLLRIHALVRRLGRRTLIWGDHVLKHEGLRDMLPREIMICNWLYGAGHSTNYEDTTNYFLDAGFEVLGCPAGCWGGTYFVPHADNLNNIASFHRCSRKINHPRQIGMMNCLWVPWRYLPATVHPVTAWAGKLFSTGETDMKACFTEFMREQFGLKGRVLDSAAAAVLSLHVDRQRNLLEKDLMSAQSGALEARQTEIVRFRDVCAHAESLLNEALPGVTRGAEEFGQWILTAGVMRGLAEARLAEITVMASDPVARRKLHDRFRTAWFQCRDYRGAESEEPAMGQIARYDRSGTPVELLAQLAGVADKLNDA